MVIIVILFVDCNEVKVPAIACCILAPFSKKPATSNNDTTTTDNTEATIIFGVYVSSN